MNVVWSNAVPYSPLTNPRDRENFPLIAFITSLETGTSAHPVIRSLETLGARLLVSVCIRRKTAQKLSERARALVARISGA